MNRIDEIKFNISLTKNMILNIRDNTKFMNMKHIMKLLQLTATR